MTIIVASWGGEHLVAVQDNGDIIESSGHEATVAVQQALREPVRVWTEDDATKLYAPGDPGFVHAALMRLPDATVTGGEA